MCASIHLMRAIIEFGCSLQWINGTINSNDVSNISLRERATI